MRSFRLNEPLSPLWRHPIITALLWQILLMIFALLMLDGHRMAVFGGVMLLAYWWTVTWMVVQRPMSPTVGDLRWIRWGHWPIFACGALVGALIL